jgi:hypothetical protein
MQRARVPDIKRVLGSVTARTAIKRAYIRGCESSTDESLRTHGTKADSGLTEPVGLFYFGTLKMANKAKKAFSAKNEHSVIFLFLDCVGWRESERNVWPSSLRS